MTLESLRDTEGYLIQPEDWDETIAVILAKEEGIKLGDTHWLILQFMRCYYNEHAITPDVRHVIDYLVNKNGYEKKAAKKLIFDLFPYGYVKQACKIAGMKRPRAWSTG